MKASVAQHLWVVSGLVVLLWILTPSRKSNNASSTALSHELLQPLSQTLGIPVLKSITSGCRHIIKQKDADGVSHVNLTASSLPDYQSRGYSSLLNFLKKYNVSTKDIALLEHGSDVSGRVGDLIAKQVKTYVGINCQFEGDDVARMKIGEPNAMYVGTCCKQLPFPDNTFDVVFSDNVLEHVEDVRLFINETFRVLKDNGLVLIMFDPVWTGPFGHHMHDDMVQRRAKALGTTSK